MTTERAVAESPAVGPADRRAYLSPLSDFLVVVSVTLLVAIGGVLLLVP